MSTDKIAKKWAEKFIRIRGESKVLSCKEDLIAAFQSACEEATEKLQNRLDISTDQQSRMLREYSADTKRLDILEKLSFTNREGERELHFDYKGSLREAIDGTVPP